MLLQRGLNRATFKIDKHEVKIPSGNRHNLNNIRVEEKIRLLNKIRQ